TGDHPHRQHRPQIVEQREQAPADQGSGAGRGRGGRFHRLGRGGGGRSLVQRTARPATSPARIARLARMDTRDPARPRARTPADRRQAAMALPPLPDADAAVIDAFLDATWAEAGLARPTLDSYRRDLGGFARWRGGRDGGLAGADRAALFDYLAWRMRENYSPRSNARLLSALRAFYGWRVRRGERTDDPTALLEPPRLPRLLPKALAESQVDALLDAPDVDDPIGLRDRAMLELMYACGLRVSELANLPATALNLRQG